MASVHAMMHEIHVLLADHDSEALINTAKQLEICQYRVTFVELASAAISILLSGIAKFDVVIANINSPDLHGFKLLQQAVAMGLPVLIISTEDNALMAMRALENGAFLYIKKPATMEILRCLWQHVLREKTRMPRERDVYAAAAARNGVVEYRHPAEYPNLVITNKKKIDVSEDHEECDSVIPRMALNNVRRKMCTEWTQELHAKFMDAVEQLGEGRCFPKEILELMNVPGLTRMQVASHLQKCRNDNWRPPEYRKFQTTSTQNTNGPQLKSRRFGSKPQVRRTHSGPVQVGPQEMGRISETHSWTDTQNINGPKMENESTVTHTYYHHKKYGSIGPYPSNATPGTNSSSNTTRYSPDGYFDFPGMNCVMRNLSGGPHKGSGMDNPNPAHGAIQLDLIYNDVQKSGGGSIERRSNWSSETSSFESVHSDTESEHCS